MAWASLQHYIVDDDLETPYPPASTSQAPGCRYICTSKPGISNYGNFKTVINTIFQNNLKLP